MYPLCIPSPSRMGDFTYARFIKYGDVYRDPIMKKKRITWTENELKVNTVVINIEKFVIMNFMGKFRLKR